MAQETVKRESIAKIKFKLFLKNFRKNWSLFSESKMGMYGLWVIIAFGIFGALSPIVLNVLDPSIYDPVVGLDNRVLSPKYISHHLSTQNLVKGIEVPSAQIWVHSFIDKGEQFRQRMEELVINAQREMMPPHVTDAFRHLLDTIADSYVPLKERLYFQASVSELSARGVLGGALITSVKDIGDREKFSFTDFSKLLEIVDYKTLAIAVSPFRDTDEVSRIVLWFRALNRPKPEIVEEFTQTLEGDYADDEVRRAQSKVLEAAASVASAAAGGQINVQTDKRLSEVIKNNAVPTDGLISAAVYGILPDLLVLAKDRPQIAQNLQNSTFAQLVEFAQAKLPDLDKREAYEPLLRKAQSTINNILAEMGEAGIEKTLEDTETFLRTYAGMELAKVTIDLEPDVRAKLEAELEKVSPDVRQGYVAQLNNLFIKISLARTFMSKLLSNENVPEEYESLGTKVVQVLSDPITSLMAYAFRNTPYLPKIIENIETSQLDDFKRLDFVEELRSYDEPLDASRFLFGEGDINDDIYRRLVEEHRSHLSPELARAWDGVKKPSDIERPERTPWTREFAERKVVEIFNTMSITNKIGVGHPLPPSRWHWLGTDPIGRDVLIQLMVSTPSEFMLGVLAALITVVIGTIIGTAAAYYGGLVDVIFMRIADLMMLFPTIAFLIVLSGFMTMDLFKLALILGILGGFGGITLVLKAQALTVKVKPYIDAARVSGGSHAYIIFNHIIPNVMPLSFLYMMFNVTGAVFSEAVLSFFGLMKVRMSWGLMINTVWSSGYLGSGNIGAFWWLWVPSGGAITLLCSAFYFLGRGLEEIVNPRLRKR